jgi:hypothetical protein
MKMQADGHPDVFRLSLSFSAEGKGPVREALGYLRRPSKAALLDVTPGESVMCVHFVFS